ncbi:MAG: hypothetical protein ABEI53_00940 [Candidatus Magasanikbacteria bacterium]
MNSNLGLSDLLSPDSENPSSHLKEILKKNNQKTEIKRGRIRKAIYAVLLLNPFRKPDEIIHELSKRDVNPIKARRVFSKIMAEIRATKEKLLTCKNYRSAIKELEKISDFNFKKAKLLVKIVSWKMSFKN